MSIFKQFLSPSSDSKNIKSSRRKSEVATAINNDIEYDLETIKAGDVDPTKNRRHSVPEAELRAARMTALDTIDENENLPVKTPSITMNLSPSNRNSPKEKRSFTFFRSRTLSSSSNESNGGGGGGSGGGGQSTSPRLSPRSIFDKVRKRSQSDAKSQTSVDQLSNNNSNNSLNVHQHNLQLHLQQQLQEQLLQQQQQLLKNKNILPQQIVNGLVRKHLSHSISEENDEAIHNELNNNNYIDNDKNNPDFNNHFGHPILSSSSSKSKMNQKLTFNNSIGSASNNSSNTNSSSNVSLSNSGNPSKQQHLDHDASPSASANTHLHPLFQKSPKKQLSTPVTMPHANQNLRQFSLSPQIKYLDLDNMLATIENNQIFTYFMKHKFCYDIMPKSAKIVVFDTQLLVKKAFFALIYNGVRAAPLWDSKNQKFVGMLTITDFILILQKYYKEANAKIEQLEEHKLETWREVLKEYRRPFIYLRPEDSLFDAIKVLTKNRVHRLPIIDPITGNVVCIVTHKRILRFLYLFIYDMPQPQFLSQTIADLKIGTYDKIRTIQASTPVIEALNIFVSTRVSALPVVDQNQRLVNIYSKFDVIDLAAEKTYTNLDVSVIEALEYRRNRFDGVASCTKNETLGTIMERIVNKEVHRLIIVDEEKRVSGIISLSDILTFIVLKQSEQDTLSPDQTANSKTTSLTHAFGLTRLSASVDHVVLNESGSSSKLVGSSGNLSVNMNETPNSNSNSRTNSPFAATVSQPQMSTIDQAIFEDDPMETETVK